MLLSKNFFSFLTVSVFILTLGISYSMYVPSAYAATATACSFVDVNGNSQPDGLSAPLPRGDSFYWNNDYKSYVIGHQDGSVTLVNLVCAKEGANIAPSSGTTGGGAIDFTSTVVPSTKFAVGNKVKTTNNVNVRSTGSLSATSIGTVPAGTSGTVAGGSTYASGYHWWKVSYSNGLNGWTAENFLINFTDYENPIQIEGPGDTPVLPPPTSSSSCLDIQVTLQSGSAGDQVIALQRFLISRSLLVVPSGTDLGYFGPITEAAVKAFQSANGISAIGIVGPQTRAIIKALTCTVQSGTTGSTGATSTTNTGTPSVSVSANGQYGAVRLALGEGLTLSWRSVNATSCSAGAPFNFPVVVNSYNVTPIAPGNPYYPASGGTTYTIVCSNGSQSMSSSVTVSVSTTGTTGSTSQNSSGTGSYPAGCTSSIGNSTTTGLPCGGQPGNTQSQSGVGTIPPITQIFPVPSANGPQQFRLYGGGLLSRYGIAFVSNDNPNLSGRATPFDTVDSNGSSGLATIDLGGVRGSWSLRVTDPVTYSTSPWYTINVSASGSTSQNSSGTGSYPAGCTSSIGNSTTTGLPCGGQPGNTQSQSGVGTIPPITQISPAPSASGNQQVRVYGAQILSRYNVAFVSNDDPYLPGRAASFDTVDSNGSTGLITVNLGGVSGSWSARITDPVTYSTSPWYTINVSP